MRPRTSPAPFILRPSSRHPHTHGHTHPPTHPPTQDEGIMRVYGREGRGFGWVELLPGEAEAGAEPAGNGCAAAAAAGPGPGPATPAVEDVRKRCAGCGKPRRRLRAEGGGLRTCGRCRAIFYCGPECQVRAPAAACALLLARSSLARRSTPRPFCPHLLRRSSAALYPLLHPPPSFSPPVSRLAEAALVRLPPPRLPAGAARVRSCLSARRAAGGAAAVPAGSTAALWRSSSGCGWLSPHVHGLHAAEWINGSVQTKRVQTNERCCLRCSPVNRRMERVPSGRRAGWKRSEDGGENAAGAKRQKSRTGRAGRGSWCCA